MTTVALEATVVIRHHDQAEHKTGMKNSAEEKAPNSRSSTELPGANRSWVAVGDDPEALQQRGGDDVKAESLPSKARISNTSA
ncbi:hypothetical protein TU81_01245 [Pseudomonas lini]|jgi:hypothetical protein|nr:hypothetical protein TU81_01245 [Pseudomonas lini]